MSDISKGRLVGNVLKVPLFLLSELSISSKISVASVQEKSSSIEISN